MIKQMQIDPVPGFYFLHYLLSVVMGIGIDPQNFQTAFLTAQNIINRELAKYEQWRHNAPLITEQTTQQYFIRMRDRVLNELMTLQRLNGAGATNPPVILKPNEAKP